MPFYECVFIARQDISSSQVEGLVGQFSKIIEDNGGRVAKTEMWGLRNLAYRIKKNRKGHYALFNLDASTAAIQEMERNMRLNEDVIRYLTTRVDELEEGPSIVMQSKHSRDDRGGRGGRSGFRDDRGGRGGRGGFRGDRDGGHARHGDGPRASEEATAESETTDKKEGRTDAKPEEKPEAEAKQDEKKARTDAKPEEQSDAKPEEKPEAEAKKDEKKARTDEKPGEQSDAKPEEKPEAEAKQDEKEAGQ
jgi:small subunit ribosomal protein S6